MIIILALFGAVLLAAGCFIVLSPDRYTAWRRRRQPEVMRMLETRSLADQRPETRTNGWFLLILGAGMLVLIISRSGPTSWYGPGILIFTAFGCILLLAVAVSLFRLPRSPGARSPGEIREVINRLRASQGLPPQNLTDAEIDAAMATARARESKPRRLSVLGLPLNGSKVWAGIVVVCGLASLLGRTVYPMAADHFGYALPGDAFGDLPGHLTYNNRAYNNFALCDATSGETCPGRPVPACYSPENLIHDGAWPLAQVTGIPTLPGPIRQVYAPASHRMLPPSLYVYAGTYHCYVAYRPIGTVVFGRAIDQQQNAASVVDTRDTVRPGQPLAIAAYLLRPAGVGFLLQIIGGYGHVTHAERIRIGKDGYVSFDEVYGAPAVRRLFPASGRYRISFLQGHTVLATGTITVNR